MAPGPWPYADIWPYPRFEGGHHDAGLRLDSGQEYQLDFFSHAQFIHMAGRVQVNGAPFGEIVLSMQQDGSNLQTTRYDHLLDTKATVTATGARTFSGPVLPGNYFLLRNVLPGTYTLGLNQPDYTTQSKTITIAPWLSPGILPTVPPGDPTYFFPGIPHFDPQFNLTAEWKTKGTIDINLHRWVATDPPSYSDSGPVGPGFFRMAGLPDRLFTFQRFGGGIPAPSYTVWYYHGDGWFTSGGAGSATFDSYDGGPRDNTKLNQAPSGVSSYTLDLHALSTADRSIEIPGVTVKFRNSSRPAGGQVAHDDSPDPVDATHSAGQWFFAGSEVTVVNAATRLVRVNVLMRRAMVVQGKVTGSSGAIPGAAVVLRNRWGVAIRQVVTTATGTFRFDTVEPQAVYLDVSRRGFIAQRTRFEPPSVNNPDITADFTLAEVPGPSIDSFTMNRFGAFLPGVSKSGDAKGFNPENAREKLTVTWKSEARGKEFEVSFDGYSNPDGSQKPDETFQVVDPVMEVYLVDRRAFTNTFVNDPNQNVHEAVLPPAPLNYVTFLKWMEEISSARKNGRPYYVIHQLVARGQSGVRNNRFEGKLNLWELPSGVFNPRLVAITEKGGVTIKDYELPAGKATLQGMNLPQWVSGLAEAIGVGANFGKFTGDINAHYGEGYLKIGTISPVMEARIGLDPLTNEPAADNNLTYKYTLGVELPLGEGTTESGPLQFGPSFLGYKVTGVNVELKVTGKDKKTALALVANAGFAPDFQKRNADFTPVVAKRPKPLDVKATLKHTAKIGAAEILDADALGNNTLGGYSFLLDAQGTADFQLKINATPVLDKFPYVGPVLLGLDRSGAFTIYALFELTLGAKLTLERATTYPKPGGSGTQTRGDQGERFDILGSSSAVSKNKVEFKAILRVAGGLQASVLNGSGELSGLFQAGAPNDTPDSTGIVFTIDPINRAPLLQKIDGAFSFVLRAAVNLWTVQFQKQWQWDIARWSIDRRQTGGAALPGLSALAASPIEPAFYLDPMYITYTVFNPATSPPFKFLGKGRTLVDSFYKAGSFDVSAGAKPLLVFTGTEPSGRMTLAASVNGNDQWNAPVQITTAAGIIATATIENPAGGWIAVWSEIAEADVNNPYPASTLKYSLSNPQGGVWSAPAVLTSANAAMFDLKLASVGSKLLLTWTETTEGPLARNRSLHSAMWDGARWSAPAELLASGPLSSYELSGSTNVALLAASIGTNELVTWEWRNSNWSGPEKLGKEAEMVALGFGTAQQALLAWRTSDEAIGLAAYVASAGVWLHLPSSLTNTPVQSLQVVPIRPNGELLYVLAWTFGGETTSIFYTIVDPAGALRMPVTEATVGSAGIYRNLQGRTLPGGHAAFSAQYSTATNSVIQEIVVGLPADADCNGNGVWDALEIANGAVRDCNGNGIPDDCEIAAGLVEDRNRNGIPDVCETPIQDDCNRNGISDAYEITLGIADFNGNGVLDDCESLLVTKTLNLSRNLKQHFYRAASLSIRSHTVESVELEFEGALEEAETVNGPWKPVP